MRRTLALVALAAGLAPWGCADAKPSADSRTDVRIAQGGSGSVSALLGEALAAVYARELPEVEVTSFTGGGSRSHAEAIDEGRAELAFVQADVAYLAFTGAPSDPSPPRSRLRGISTLFMNVMHLVATPDSGIRSMEDLDGRRVGISSPQSATRQTAEILLEGFGLTREIDARELGTEETLAALRGGGLDAAFMMSSYPAPPVQELVDRTDIRLIPIRGPVVEALLAEYPFLRPVIVPSTIYGYPNDLETVGTRHLLVCRDDLNEDLVYRLTRIFFDALPAELAPVHEAFSRIDLEAAPATPIPLHPGAARFYRELEIFR